MNQKSSVGANIVLRSDELRANDARLEQSVWCSGEPPFGIKTCGHKRLIRRNEEKPLPVATPYRLTCRTGRDLHVRASCRERQDEYASP